RTGFPEDRAHLLDEIAIPIFGCRDRFTQQNRFGLLALRDVERHALQERWAAEFVLDQSRLAAHPHQASIPGDQTALGAKRPAGAAATRKFFIEKRLVVRMELSEPEKRVFEPLLLSESEQRLDVRTDVDF